MDICYITRQLPWGTGETFIVEEILEGMNIGNRVICFSVRPSLQTETKIFNEKASTFENCYDLPFYHMRVLTAATFLFTKHPYRCISVFIDVLKNTIDDSCRPWRALIKNLVILTKSLYIADICIKNKISHIHAHWATTPSTVAYVVSSITDIPFSFTSHGQDLSLEQDCLRIKLSKCKFNVTTTEFNRIWINQNYPSGKEAIVLNPGVRVPQYLCNYQKEVREFLILCVANLVPKKGHKYLLEAIKILSDRGCNVKCLLVGDGYLRRNIEEAIQNLQIGEKIKLLGLLPHDQVLDIYKKYSIGAFVLPSIITSSGEKEGLPIALMEAMAHCIPVISTRTVGIPELVDKTGYLIEPENSLSLANAIERLIIDPSYAEMLGKLGYEKVKEKYNLEKNTQELYRMMMNA